MFIERALPRTCILASLFLSMCALFAQQEMATSKRPWKGYAILGNGRLCAVYSDDARIVSQTKSSGIQHLYFNDYTADYVSSTSFDVIGAGSPVRTDSLAMEGSVGTFTRSYYPEGLLKDVRCFVHPSDAVVLSLAVSGRQGTVGMRFQLKVRNHIVTDRVTTLSSLRKSKEYAVALWSNGTVLLIAPQHADGQLIIRDSTVLIDSRLQGGGSFVAFVIASKTEEGAKAFLAQLRADKDPIATAVKHWDAWLNQGRLPVLRGRDPGDARYLDFYKRNLYAAKAANIRGQIPADITGQFVTHNMPQLYPRDAMMCARVFLLTGHPEEAAEVVSYWSGPNVPRKSRGEFYARYDAYGKAVDAGTGARYDEPEWDANGYFLQLVKEYQRQNGNWLAEKGLIFELADFLVDHIDHSGLLYEGGIVEWRGYLPATNMTCAAALQTAGGIAQDFGDAERSERYQKASRVISASLATMFDPTRESYADVRFSGVAQPVQDTLRLWDASFYFGAVWGFPDHDKMKKSDVFYQKHATALGGGMRYFEAVDNAGLSAYGGDVFFFTTSAAAQYHARYGNRSKAKAHIDWMMQNSNSYGLMPERIYSNQSDCSPASPLSWCCAEFAAAILLWSEE